MVEWGDVRAGMATVLGEIDGLRVHDVWPAGINPPAALIRPGRSDILTETTFAGAPDLFLDVEMVVADKGGVERAQRDLDPYLDPTGAKSIIAAVYADPTLDGACSDVILIGISNWGGRSINEVSDYLGATIHWRVLS